MLLSLMCFRMMMYKMFMDTSIMRAEFILLHSFISTNIILFSILHEWKTFYCVRCHVTCSWKPCSVINYTASCNWLSSITGGGGAQLKPRKTCISCKTWSKLMTFEDLVLEIVLLELFPPNLEKKWRWWREATECNKMISIELFGSFTLRKKKKKCWKGS